MSVLAQRYAAALADVVLEKGIADEARRQLAEFIEMFAASPELRNFLETPAVPPAVKRDAITKLGARTNMADAVRNFLLMITDHRRTAALGEIQQAFEVEVNRRMGVAEAEVTSAREMASDERAEFVKALERVTGKQVRAKYATDAGLIGGAVVRIGSTIFDGSVREQLERLRARLTAE